MSEQIILAGDMALNYGFAIGSTEEGFVASTAGSVESIRMKQGVAAASSKVREHAVEFAFEYVECVDLIVFEEVTSQNHGPGQLTQYAMLTGFLQAGIGLYAGGETLSYYPATIKARGAGHGRASKRDMIRAAHGWSGKKPATDDEADAILLLKLALEDTIAKQPKPLKMEELPF